MLIDRVLQYIKTRRERILSGKINCIPSPLKGFIGIEQGTYYLMSGASKSGKTQITNYLFLFTPILYAYYNPELLRVKIFYFPLEETPEKITMRFICHLLYILSDGEIRVSVLTLGSINKDNMISKEILEIIQSEEYQSILKFFEEHVHFIPERNPTGAWKTVYKYALEAGTIHRKIITIENKKTGIKQEKEVFDYYEPKDPDEYVLIIYDHASLTEQERGMTKKEAIDKLSEYFMIFRNNYNYSPVLIQQQNSDTISLDAVRAGRISPTLNGLADTKNTGKDCTVMLGITNPYSFGLPEYLKYDIVKLKGYARFLEIALNREGEQNEVTALYFDGAVNYFVPLPKQSDAGQLAKVYTLVESHMKKR